MPDLCGFCYHFPCVCLTIVKPPPSDGATGLELDALAERAGIKRAVHSHYVETDENLRARLQLTVVLGRPYLSGVECGERLDKIGARRGIFREPGESDARYRARQMLDGKAAPPLTNDHRQANDPYRISEYTAQSFHDGYSTKKGGDDVDGRGNTKLPPRGIPTQAEADAAMGIHALKRQEGPA